MPALLLGQAYINSFTINQLVPTVWIGCARCADYPMLCDPKWFPRWKSQAD